MKSRIIPIIALVFSILATIVSLVTLCRGTRNEDAAILVGGMAALITVLIGWQIFSIIDLKGYSSKLKQLDDDMRDEMERVKIVAFLSVAHANVGYMTENPVEFHCKEYIRYSLEALNSAAYIKNYVICDDIVYELLKNIKQNSNIRSIVESDHTNILNDLIGLPGASRIKDYDKLIQYITNDINPTR